MASPCEVLLESGDVAEARRVFAIAGDEARRVEKKFSRYLKESVVSRIHAARGRPFEVDPETADLLDFAGQAFHLSGGAFDITSGVLRRLWPFGSHAVEGRVPRQLPSSAAITAMRERVGWPRVTWQRPHITLPEGMEIDLGGIAKEYAVDRALGLIGAESAAPVLVNFGGDLRVSGPRRGGAPWRVAIESVEAPNAPDQLLALQRGALATSGDTHRFLEISGRRYGHILDPRSGWPVEGAPRSVTVLAPTCIEAGILATLAMLQGPAAEEFLRTQETSFWCRR